MNMLTDDIIGIDPGLGGAVARISARTGIYRGVWDMPKNVQDFLDLRLTILQVGIPMMVILEKAQAMPKQGVVSMFNYGVQFGQCQMFAGSFHVRVEEVSPRKWKGVMNILLPGGADKEKKEKARGEARKIWPDAPLDRKKDHNRAEALLLAEYGRRAYILS